MNYLDLLNNIMRNLLKSFLIALLFSLCGCSNNEISGDLIITNINVIDVENLLTEKNQTIAIENGIIKSITSYSNSDVYNSENVIDGTDKYIIPGLWDMHVHYSTSRQHPNFRNLFIANGVLGVRDLWGNLDV